MLVNTLLFIIILSLIILFSFSVFFFRLSNYKKKHSLFNKPISIIICAKNEENNLKKNLPLILSQNYEDFEVIVVNDQSTDGTFFFLEQIEKEYPNLVIVTIDDYINHYPGKKFPLTLGIKTAKYEHLLLTDADCIPNSKKWIKNISSEFNNYDIVLGFGGYKKEKGLLNKIIRFDTFNVAQQYLSYSLWGMTYMGVGRNLAYKKSLFFKNKGFASHIHIQSGDDDLFIQEVAESRNVSISIDPDTHTYSIANNNWCDWIYQKRRHINAAPHYKNKFKILLSIYFLSQMFFWISLITLLFFGDIPLVIPLIFLFIKLIMSYLVNYKIMHKLNLIDLYWFHPLYEFINTILQVFFVLLNTINKPIKWNR